MMEHQCIVLNSPFPVMQLQHHTTPVLFVRLVMHTEQSGALGLAEQDRFYSGRSEDCPHTLPLLAEEVVAPSSSAGPEPPGGS